MATAPLFSESFFSNFSGRSPGPFAAGRFVDLNRRLKSAVGPGQPNEPADVLLIQRLLNLIIGSNSLFPFMPPIWESGAYDPSTAQALHVIEYKYFYGVAEAGHRVLPDGEFFEFLRQAAYATCELNTQPRLSAEVIHLAALMVPGGVNRRIPDNIHLYLPDILRALEERQISDADMILVALATIRAETSEFDPVAEGQSRFNTSKPGTPNHHPFDLYDNRKDLGNTGPPDGFLFRGRGFVQLTGRKNYEMIGDEIGQEDLVESPDIATLRPAIAAKILAQYLKDHEARIRSALGRNDLAAVRRQVNGGSNGLAQFISAMNAGRLYLQRGLLSKATQRAKQSHRSEAMRRKAAAWR